MIYTHIIVAIYNELVEESQLAGLNRLPHTGCFSSPVSSMLQTGLWLRLRFGIYEGISFRSSAELLVYDPVEYAPDKVTGLYLRFIAYDTDQVLSSNITTTNISGFPWRSTQGKAFRAIRTMVECARRSAQHNALS